MQVTQGRPRSFEITPISRTCVTMTSNELCSVSTQLASGLQAHHSANNCLASCLYNDGVVQAVTFAYLSYWWVSCFSSHRMCHSLLQSRKLKLGTHWRQSRQTDRRQIGDKVDCRLCRRMVAGSGDSRLSTKRRQIGNNWNIYESRDDPVSSDVISIQWQTKTWFWRQFRAVAAAKKRRWLDAAQAIQ